MGTLKYSCRFFHLGDFSVLKSILMLMIKTSTWNFLQKSQFSPQSKSHLFDIFEVPGNALKCFQCQNLFETLKRKCFIKNFFLR